MQWQQCRRELTANEPINRVAVSYGVNAYYKFGGAVASICKRCALATTAYETGASDVVTIPNHSHQQWRNPSRARIARALWSSTGAVADRCTSSAARSE
jgi:hypothetical protein